MGKRFINGEWYTELGRKIALNDIVREMKRCLHEYIEFHKQPMPKRLKARMSRKSWRCFHCDEVFTNATAARDHFGSSVMDEPACQTDATRLRALEEELRRYRNDDTDLHRQIASIQTAHQTSLMRAEESGYAKGLKDGREMITSMEGLLMHAYIHSNYPDCGFMQMTTPQKKKFVELLKARNFPEGAERLSGFIVK